MLSLLLVARWEIRRYVMEMEDLERASTELYIYLLVFCKVVLKLQISHQYGNRRVATSKGQGDPVRIFLHQDVTVHKAFVFQTLPKYYICKLPIYSEYCCRIFYHQHSFSRLWPSDLIKVSWKPPSRRAISLPQIPRLVEGRRLQYQILEFDPK